MTRTKSALVLAFLLGIPSALSKGASLPLTQLKLPFVEGTGLYGPVKATIATQIGPVRIYATHFERVAN